MPGKFGVFNNVGIDTDSDDEPVYEQIIVIGVCQQRCRLNFKTIYFNTSSILTRRDRSGSKNSDQNFKKLRYNSRQDDWRRDERTTQKIHSC